VSCTIWIGAVKVGRVADQLFGIECGLDRLVVGALDVERAQVARHRTVGALVDQRLLLAEAEVLQGGLLHAGGGLGGQEVPCCAGDVHVGGSSGCVQALRGRGGLELGDDLGGTVWHAGRLTIGLGSMTGVMLPGGGTGAG